MGEKYRIMKGLGVLVSLIVGAVFGITVVLPIFSVLNTHSLWFILLFVCISCVVTLYLQVILHELGHLVFGSLAGYTLIMFRIENFAFVRTENSVRLRRIGIPGTGGQCLMRPPEGGGEHVPFVLYNLGGGLMNLIAAGLCIPLFFAAPSLPGAFLYIFGVLGVFLAVMNLVPIKFGDVPNDGVNLLNCHRSQENRRAFYNILMVTGGIVEGIRLTDMEPDWFVVSPEAELNDLTAQVRSLAAAREMDEGRLREAEAMIRPIATSGSVAAAIRGEAAAELLYLKAVSGAALREVEAAMTKELQKYMRVATTSLTARRCRCAYALARGEGVSEARAEWERALQRSALGSDAALERKLMDRLLAGY